MLSSRDSKKCHGETSIDSAGRHHPPGKRDPLIDDNSAIPSNSNRPPARKTETGPRITPEPITCQEQYLHDSSDYDVRNGFAASLLQDGRCAHREHLIGCLCHSDASIPRLFPYGTYADDRENRRKRPICPKTQRSKRAIFQVNSHRLVHS